MRNKPSLTIASSLVFILMLSCGRRSDESTAIKDTTREALSHQDAASTSHESVVIKYTVLVLPPFDLIANEGVSPDIQKYLEDEISKDSSFSVIPFPLKKLMNTPYYQVFDKKYCGPVLEKVPADLVIMSKLDQCSRTGNMNDDGWEVSFKMFNPKTDQQRNSKITISNNAAGIRRDLAARRDELIAELKNITTPNDNN